jgi:hypothetical protein
MPPRLPDKGPETSTITWRLPAQGSGPADAALGIMVGPLSAWRSADLPGHRLGVAATGLLSGPIRGWQLGKTLAQFLSRITGLTGRPGR